MDQKSKSTTEKETWVEESIFNLGGHHKTSITDGDRTVTGRGNTSEESQKIASEKWKNK